MLAIINTWSIFMFCVNIYFYLIFLTYNFAIFLCVVYVISCHKKKLALDFTLEFVLYWFYCECSLFKDDFPVIIFIHIVFLKVVIYHSFFWTWCIIFLTELAWRLLKVGGFALIPYFWWISVFKNHDLGTPVFNRVLFLLDRGSCLPAYFPLS